MLHKGSKMKGKKLNGCFWCRNYFLAHPVICETAKVGVYVTKCKMKGLKFVQKIGILGTAHILPR